MFVDYSSQDEYTVINARFAERYIEMLYVEGLPTPEDRLGYLKARAKNSGIGLIQGLELQDFDGNFNWINYLYGLVISREHTVQCMDLLLGCPTLYMVEFALEGCHAQEAYNKESKMRKRLRLTIKSAYGAFIEPCEKVIDGLQNRFLALRPERNLPFSRFDYLQKVLYNEMFPGEAGTYKYHAGLLIMPFTFPSQYKYVINDEGYPKSSIKVRFHKWSGNKTALRLGILKKDDVRPFCIEEKVVSVWRRGRPTDLFEIYSRLLQQGKLLFSEEPHSETTIILKDIKARSAMRNEKLLRFEDLVTPDTSSFLEAEREALEQEISLFWRSRDSEQDKLGDDISRSNKTAMKTGCSRSSSSSPKVFENAIASDPCLPLRVDSWRGIGLDDDDFKYPEEKTNHYGHKSPNNSGADAEVRKLFDGDSDSDCEVGEEFSFCDSVINFQQATPKRNSASEAIEPPPIKMGKLEYSEMNSIEKDIYLLLEGRKADRKACETQEDAYSESFRAKKSKKFQQTRKELMERENEIVFGTPERGPPLLTDGVIDANMKLAASRNLQKTNISSQSLKTTKPVSEIVAMIEHAEKMIKKKELVQQLKEIEDELDSIEGSKAIADIDSASVRDLSAHKETIAQSTNDSDVNVFQSEKYEGAREVSFKDYNYKKTRKPARMSSQCSQFNVEARTSSRFGSQELPLRTAIELEEASNNDQQSVIINRHLFPIRSGSEDENLTESQYNDIKLKGLGNSLDLNVAIDHRNSGLSSKKDITRDSAVPSTGYNRSSSNYDNTCRDSREAIFSYQLSDSNSQAFKEAKLSDTERGSSTGSANNSILSYFDSPVSFSPFSEKESVATSHVRLPEKQNSSQIKTCPEDLLKFPPYVSENGVLIRPPPIKLDPRDPHYHHYTYMASPLDPFGEPELVYTRPFKAKSKRFSERIRDFISPRTSAFDPPKKSKGSFSYDEMYPTLSNVRFRDFIKFKARKMKEDIKYFSDVAKLCVIDFRERPITAERELYEQFT